MNQQIEDLLECFIDYAGLFPPAKLSAPDAIHEFLEFRKSNDWLSSNFATPLNNLIALTEAWPGDLEDTGFCLLGNARVEGDFAQALEEDLSKIDSLPDHLIVVSYEIKAIDQAGLARVVDATVNCDYLIPVEIPYSEDLTSWILPLSETDNAMPKFRTGGTEPGSVPIAESLAHFISECVQLDVPFKLTAGLHHAYPNKNKETGDIQHGFLNVLAATTLATTEDFNRKELTEVLLASPQELIWEGDSFVWKGESFGLEELREGKLFFQSFGSCSLAEPLADLRAYRLVN